MVAGYYCCLAWLVLQEVASRCWILPVQVCAASLKHGAHKRHGVHVYVYERKKEMYVCWCDVCSCVHTCFSELHESHTAYPRHTNGQKAHVLEGRRLLTTNLGHYRENQTLSWRVATQEVFFAVKYFSLRVIKTITTMTMMKLATGMIFFKADETDEGNDGFEDDVL